MATKKVATAKKGEQQRLRPEGLRIVAFEVENIKRVKVARIVPKGDLIEITGKNGQGKSSLLEAIDWTLTGTTNMPSQPIRKGEQSARIKVDLGDFIVERTFTKINGGKSDHITKLKITGKNRELYPSPQKLLDGFMGAFTFDPLAFTRLEGRKQLELLRKVVTFEVDIDALETMRKQTYEDRRIKGREVEAQWAKLKGHEVPAEDLPKHLIDTKPFLEEMQSAGERAAEIERAKGEKARYERNVQECKDLVATRENQIRELMKQAESLKSEISATLLLEETAKKGLASVVIPEPIDTAATAERLREAQSTNTAIMAAGNYRDAKKAAEKLEGEYTELDARYNGLTTKREEAIAGAKMPIEGLAVGDDEVLYKGLPFNQASTAEQIRASAAIAMALSPRLRVMRIMDGSLLDDDSMAILAEMADRENYQIFVERVGNGEVGIVMEDGLAHGEGVQA